MTWNMTATADTTYETENGRRKKREILHHAMAAMKKVILPEQAEKNINLSHVVNDCVVTIDCYVVCLVSIV